MCACVCVHACLHTRVCLCVCVYQRNQFCSLFLLPDQVFPLIIMFLMSFRLYLCPLFELKHKLNFLIGKFVSFMKHITLIKLLDWLQIFLINDWKNLIFEWNQQKIILGSTIFQVIYTLINSLFSIYEWRPYSIYVSTSTFIAKYKIIDSNLKNLLKIK